MGIIVTLARILLGLIVVGAGMSLVDGVVLIAGLLVMANRLALVVMLLLAGVLAKPLI